MIIRIQAFLDKDLRGVEGSFGGPTSPEDELSWGSRAGCGASACGVGLVDLAGSVDAVAALRFVKKPGIPENVP